MLATMFNLDHVDIFYEVLTHLTYLELSKVSQVSKKISDHCRNDYQLHQLIVAKKAEHLFKLSPFTQGFLIYRTNGVILYPCLDLEIYDALIRRGSDPSFLDNYLIRYASINGHLDLVQKLLQDPRVDPSANNNEAFSLSLNNWHLHIAIQLFKNDKVYNKLDVNLRSTLTKGLEILNRVPEKLQNYFLRNATSLL